MSGVSILEKPQSITDQESIVESHREQRVQDQVEKSLSLKFHIFSGVVFFCLLSNTVMSVVHYYDVKTDNEVTIEATSFGTIFFYAFFFTLTAALVIVYIASIWIYCRLYKFLKPSEKTIALLADEKTEEDVPEEFISTKKLAKETIREAYRPKFRQFNFKFIGLIAILTLRTLMYLYLRYITWEAFYDWYFIPPRYIYTMFITDFILSIVFLSFLSQTTYLNQQADEKAFDSGRVLNPMQ
jgi:hypothetical protein